MEPREPTGQPDATVSPDDVVHLTLPVGNVPLAQMIRTQQAFLELLREVSRAVAGTVDDPVQWVVTKVSESSADYALAPLPILKTLAPATLHEMVGAVPAGLRELNQGAVRPRYFTDRALELTTTLTQTITRELPDVRTRNGAAEVRLTRQAGTHAQTILDTPFVTDMGTIEGKLETVTVHGKRQFVIFDDLTGARIECQFGHRIALDQITAGMERRVAVTGEIRSRETGEIVSVIATDIEVLPGDDELPSSDDVLGILAG